jgi:hypothetical protein
MVSGLLQRLGRSLAATSAREVFALVAASAPGYAGLDYRTIGDMGRALPAPPVAAQPGQEARA